MSRGIRIFIGICCIVLGLAGLVLPVLQGLLFLALGTLLLAKGTRFEQTLLDQLKRRFPKVGEKAERLLDKYF